MTKPDVALHLMVKNGASVVGRLLDCVGPYVRQVVAVLNDCTDDTLEELARGSSRHELALYLHPVTSVTHPHLYHLDVPESYAEDPSLCGETLDVPCTGLPLLSDWAGARNVGWCADDEDPSAPRWKLHLDADDVVDDPECLPALVSDLEVSGAEAVASEYVHSSVGGVPSVTCLRERLALRHPLIRWDGVVHERLVGYVSKRVGCVRDCLRVRDLRDSAGEGTRVPARNLKVLYRTARRAGWALPPRHLALLVAESKVLMPYFAVNLAARYLDSVQGAGSFREEAAWVSCQAGEAREGEGRPDLAVSWYEQALSWYPSACAAFRLARADHLLGQHEQAVVAYERGVRNLATLQNVDGGRLLHRQARKLVVGSLVKLGRFASALALCDEALVLDPDDQEAREARSRIEGFL